MALFRQLQSIGFVLFTIVLLVEIVLDDIKTLIKKAHSEKDSPEGASSSSSAASSITLAESSVPHDEHGIPAESFCALWSDDTDEWWTHHPEWYNDENNDTHTCFARRIGEEARYYIKIYENQWKNDCSKVYSKIMWSSGWGADFINVVYSLMNAVDMGRPYAIQHFDPVVGWHYAAVKGEGSHAACPAKDLSCYFLPMTPCEPLPKKHADLSYPNVTQVERDLYVPVYNYVTRPQQWLRKEVYDFVKTVKSTLVTPCAVMHVRRADVVLHGDHSRKYFPVSAYVDALPKNRRDHIFLLTDDQNAIDEAHEFFPKINWHYIDRPRFRGAEGGWENQIPSKSPKQEVVTILGTFQLVQMCDTIVHGQSGFSDELYRAMTMTGNDIGKYLVDSKSGPFSPHNKNSDKELEKMLEEERKKKKGRKSEK